MGGLMGTDANSGTGGTGALNGIKQWLALNGQKNLTVSSSETNENTTVRLSQMAAVAVDGAVVEPVVGYYQMAEEETGWTRVGGTRCGQARISRQPGAFG